MKIPPPFTCQAPGDNKCSGRDPMLGVADADRALLVREGDRVNCPVCRVPHLFADGAWIVDVSALVVAFRHLHPREARHG